MLYCRPKSKGQALRTSALSAVGYRPKSSLTQSCLSPVLLLLAVPMFSFLDRVFDSVVDLPRYSQRALRAKPCEGSEDVAWSDGGGPKF